MHPTARKAKIGYQNPLLRVDLEASRGLSESIESVASPAIELELVVFVSIGEASVIGRSTGSEEKGGTSHGGGIASTIWRD